MYEEIKPLQEKELLILKELKRICQKHNIKYFMIYGTLLGAIRHKGFIPWDDDIDICMEYNDYLKFEKVCDDELTYPFFLQTRNSDPGAGLSYNKLRLSNTTFIINYLSDRDMNHGISIDIYPLYNVPSNSICRNLQLVSALLYMLLQSRKAPVNHGIILNMMSKIILYVLGDNLGNKVKELCFNNMSKYESINTKHKALLFGNPRLCKMLFKAECFSKTIELHFEDEYFSAPIGSDEILTTCYGNYMKLPPKEKQIAKLDNILMFDTQKSYLSYKGKIYLKNKY